jgi:hypothetical protein
MNELLILWLAGAVYYYVSWTDEIEKHLTDTQYIERFFKEVDLDPEEYDTAVHIASVVSSLVWPISIVVDCFMDGGGGD